jgi:hypothetical protein
MIALWKVLLVLVFLAPSLLVLGAADRRAVAAPRLYAVAIGHNAPPDGDEDNLRALRYADDDAAAFFTFARSLGARAQLLAVLDPDSQRRFPELLGLARPPSLEQLSRVVAALRTDMLADLSRGDDPVLLLFYSGHGSRRTGDHPAALALAGGELTQQRLYQDILAVLPARAVHLVVDACYAADVVRPRDAQAKIVDASAGDLAHLVEATTLTRFPHVGAVLAASVTGETHEWDAYRQGVFTHQVLSALRGAADVNGDGAIEYSELLAFVSAANREVVDPRARLNVIARPPAIDRRLPIVELSRSRQASRLRFSQGAPDYFFVEDRRGDRLVEMRPEPGYRFQLFLPVGETLFLVSRAGTAELEATPGQSIAAESLTFQPGGTRARGAMSTAMRRGLFGGSFGPSYYRGFVDSAPELVAVDFSPSPPDILKMAPDPSHPVDIMDRYTGAVLGGAGLLAAASATFAVLAVRARGDFEGTSFQRQATDASVRFTRYQTAAVIAGCAAVAVTSVASWMIWRRYARRLERQAGPSVTVGVAGGVVLTW